METFLDVACVISTCIFLFSMFYSAIWCPLTRPWRKDLWLDGEGLTTKQKNDVAQKLKEAYPDCSEDIEAAREILFCTPLIHYISADTAFANRVLLNKFKIKTRIEKAVGADACDSIVPLVSGGARCVKVALAIGLFGSGALSSLLMFILWCCNKL